VTRGRFVVLEGGERCGKSTQLGLLAARLCAGAAEVVTTYEPGATAIGAVIRDLLLHGRGAVAPAAEALLMAADRAQHVAEVIRPALERGAWVLCDRYLPSSLVYQGVVRGLGVDAVEAMNRAGTRGVEPDVVVVLDVAPDRAEARGDGPRDRFEAEGPAFHGAVRDAYLRLAVERAWRVVDADADRDTVAARVWDAVATAGGA
jgi:dTMP kinase